MNGKAIKKAKFIDSIDELPHRAKVCLYGAGDGGGNFKRLLDKFRKDIEVLCFIDDFKRGERDGIKIVPLAKAVFSKKPCGLILITSTYQKEIIRNLKGNGVYGYTVVNPALFFDFQIITDDEFRRYQANIRKTRSLLAAKGDKALYDIIVKMRRSNRYLSETPKRFLRFLDLFRNEYLDYVDTAKVKTVIEGGVGDGINTSKFLDILPRDGIIYGFDPLTEVYSKSKYRCQLEKSGKVRMYARALWDRCEDVKFFEDKYNKDGARIVNRADTEAPLRDVMAVTIDDFVRREDIKKIDFIKLDIEGAELKAIRGATKTLKSHRPQLAVCIYHKKEDIFEIPLFLNSILKDYIYRIAHYTTSFWGTVWYAIPKECYMEKEG